MWSVWLSDPRQKKTAGRIEKKQPLFFLTPSPDPRKKKQLAIKKTAGKNSKNNGKEFKQKQRGGIQKTAWTKSNKQEMGGAVNLSMGPAGIRRYMFLCQSVGRRAT